jgi:hypothetical protein
MLEALAALRLRTLAGEDLDEGDRRMLAAVLERAIRHTSREQGRRLHAEGRRQQDRLIGLAGARFYAVGTLRARALALIADAKRYEATGWIHDRQHVSCPAHLRGTARELFWRTFKISARFPWSQRSIETLIRAAGPAQAA